MSASGYPQSSDGLDTPCAAVVRTLDHAASRTHVTRPKTLVSIATYNEIDNLPRLVDEILLHAPDVDILVVDDNSPDGTGDWCDEQSRTNPRLHCLHRECKLGLGTATIAAMQYALRQGYGQMVNMDADFSHHPKYLPAILAGMEDRGHSRVDCMIGSRYVPGGGVEGWPLRRRLMSRAVNLYARWLLGLSPRDCSGAFRCYSTRLLARIDFEAVRSRGYSFQEEILWHLKRLGCRFGETPITFVDRLQGQSKINLREALAAVGIIFVLGMRNWVGRPPQTLKST